MTIWPYSMLVRVYRTAEITNYTGMHLEDVLITGILRMKAYNSSDNILPRGYQGRRGKYRKPEHFVYHLGLTHNMRTSFILRWHESKAGLRMGSRDPMRSKQRSAYHYNATQHIFPVRPNYNVTGTVAYFTSSWSKLKPQRKRIFPSNEVDSKPTDQKENDGVQQNNEDSSNISIKKDDELDENAIDSRLLEY